MLRDFTRIGQRTDTPGRIGRRLLALGHVMFRWRARGMVGVEQFEPLQRRLCQALQAGMEPTNNAAEQATRTK